MENLVVLLCVYLFSLKAKQANVVLAWRLKKIQYKSKTTGEAENSGCGN
jgi:hypothetical protein